MIDKWVRLKVTGLNCNNCALGLRKQLEKLGALDVDVVFATGEVSYRSVGKDLDKLVREKIRSMGYEFEETETGRSDVRGRFKFGITSKFWFSFVFTVPLLAAMFLPWPLFHHAWFQFALATPVFLVGFRHFGASAWRSLRAGIPNMDVLIILGSTAAYVYSLIGAILQLGHDYLFFETTASIFTLILLGNMLEHIAVSRTTDSIDELVRLQRSKARRITFGPGGLEFTEEIEFEAVREGDVLLALAGEKVPVDGVILEGYGTLDESMISGESMPVEHQPGDRVIGGTAVITGSIRVKATAVGGATVLSQIIELVKQAQKDKPKLQTLADKISAVFVPIVLGVAILTFVLSYWVFSIGFQEAMLHSIAVVVIACPCALGLAIPTAVVVAVGRVAKSGILIKGASTIQKLVGVKFVVFDKTGTLTDGNFQIRELKVVDGDLTVAKSILLSLEMNSSHPLAHSIVKELEGQKVFPLSDITEEKGIGISGTDEFGVRWTAGSYRVFSADGTDRSHDVYLMRNGVLYATLDLQDRIKPGVLETIDYLKRQGLQPVLLSGDRDEKCRQVASQLGIELLYSQKLPTEKLETIEHLRSLGGVAMVGDGINDAPALAKADVGISLSNATQVAIQSAQVILLNGNIRLLRQAYSISKVTLSVIKQNLFWAFFYNIIAIPIAAAGFLDPMIAAASMALSDTIVVINSLRLRGKKL